MTEETISPETVTDAQVDAFFESGELPAEDTPVEKVEVEEPKVEKPEPKPEEEKKVNLGALHEERARRKAEAERARKAEERAAALEAEIQRYRQPQPDNDDPLDKLQREHQEVKNVLIAQAQRALQEKEESEYWERVRESEMAYKQDKPDFDEAISFLASSRIEELKDLGFDDAAAQKVLRDEIKWIADKAYQDEVNPAERFHNLAKRRGFKSNVATPPVNANAAKKLETIKKGMETNKQLPPASKSSNQDLTIEDLAGMKVTNWGDPYGKNDFDKAWEKLFG